MAPEEIEGNRCLLNNDYDQYSYWVGGRLTFDVLTCEQV